MDPFTAIMAFTTIASTLYGIAKNATDSADAEQSSREQKELAEKNLEYNKTVSTENLALQREQFEYQKQLNQLQMDREDTAFQRQIKDLQAAGLSPLMVAGNGASANPLTSATAPQRDLSGINNAIQNVVGAYNDSFNRRMAANQFRLQNYVQTAQAFTQLAEFRMQKKKADLENQYLTEKLEWEKTHGFRDLSLSSELINLLESVISRYSNGKTIKDLPDMLPDINIPDLKTGLFNDSGKALPSISELLNSFKIENELPAIAPQSQNYQPTKKEIKEDQNKIISGMKQDYNKAMNYITTRKPESDKKYTDYLEYIYRHSDASKDYKSIFTFRQALESSSDFRRNLNKKYPFIKPTTPW